MLCSFSSSFRCRSITDRMMLRSSSVRWLRSGISDPAPAGGPDILLEADGTGVTHQTPPSIPVINPPARGWVRVCVSPPQRSGIHHQDLHLFTTSNILHPDDTHRLTAGLPSCLHRRHGAYQRRRRLRSAVLHLGGGSLILCGAPVCPARRPPASPRLVRHGDNGRRGGDGAERTIKSAIG